MKLSESKARRVEVEWWDAASPEFVWSKLHDIESEIEDGAELTLCVSVCWLLHKSKRCVIICSHVALRDDGSINSFGSTMTIPRGCVKRIRRIQGPKGSPL